MMQDQEHLTISKSYRLTVSSNCQANRQHTSCSYQAAAKNAVRWWLSAYNCSQLISLVPPFSDAMTLYKVVQIEIKNSHVRIRDRDTVKSKSSIKCFSFRQRPEALNTWYLLNKKLNNLTQNICFNPCLKSIPANCKCTSWTVHSEVSPRSLEGELWSPEGAIKKAS